VAAGAIAGTRRGLWRHRDFLLLWSAQGVSAVGSRITRTALPMAAILAIGADPYELGLLAVALSLPGVLVAWFAGLLTPTGALLGAVLAETIGIRPTLVLLAVGFGVGACILTIARRTLPDERAAVAGSAATSS